MITQKEVLDTLVQMQALDDRICEKESVKEDMPKKLDDLKKELAEAEGVRDAAKTVWEDNVKAQKAHELEIKDNIAKMGKYAEQQVQVKTNKEYKALNSEINTLKEKNVKLEAEIEELKKGQADLQKDVNEKDAVRKEVADRLKAQDDELRKALDGVDEQCAELRNQRNALAKKLPTQLVKRYSMLIKHKGHKAVVFNENGACSGCGFNVRPQLQIEIAKAKGIIQCENCGRILAQTRG